jgi:hypothetical protein
MCLYPGVLMRQRGNDRTAMRRLLLLISLLAAAVCGCAGGTPENVRARWAARQWAQQRLHPDTLRVSQLQWDRDRAVVTLRADARMLTLRLLERGGSWHVVSASG